jgi:hypothetical protein
MCSMLYLERGMVNPEWTKKEREITMYDEGGDKKITKVSICWSIKKYVYSFSRHFNNPKVKKVIKNYPNNYNTHIQKCRYRNVFSHLTQRIKVFPPY